VATSTSAAIRRLHSVDDAQVEALAELLIDCVDGGAGVSFIHPLAPEKARAFWRQVAADVAAGKRVLLVAEDDTGIVGTVQLALDLPENQPHRADLGKMLVHRRARRRGLGAALMEAAENAARDCGKTLLVLDTNEGSDAERLYARMGWIPVGTIPDYSLQPRGGLSGATVFYRTL
jgi:GNAT superfamily N-acetyltransferase